MESRLGMKVSVAGKREAGVQTVGAGSNETHSPFAFSDHTAQRDISLSTMMKRRCSIGIVDHEFIDPQEGRWEVPVRVVSADNRSVFMMTLSKPERMSEQDFQAGLALVDEELMTLKRVLEAE